MFSQILSSRFRRICLIAGIALLVPVHSLARSSENSGGELSQKDLAPSPQDILDLALYYYNNDDLTGKAEISFKRLLTNSYQQTPQYEAAQFYLAAYYQRKFYLQRAKRRFDDWYALKQSAIEYRKYTDKYYNGRHNWLCDSFFNLAMVYFQLGQNQNAIDELSKLKRASEKDATVYLYQIVWSPQSQTVIDANLPTSKLADYALSIVGSDYYFDKAVLLIQKWCQAQRGVSTH